jgi:hypothetical protein
MKKFFFITLFAYNVQYISAQANQNLSNLKSPTAINVSLLPFRNNNVTLGSTPQSWKDMYLGGSIYMGGLRFLAYLPGIGAANTAVGSAALNANTSGANNTATGFNTLFNNTTGTQNTANGEDALNGGSDDSNTATGYEALYSNTSPDNTAHGDGALYANIGGAANTANGVYALHSNTIGGDGSTAIGDNALLNNTSGEENTAIGAQALSDNRTGTYNTANGAQALLNALLFNNTAIGFGAVAENTTGHSNTAVGDVALLTNTSLFNLVAVGDSALYALNGGSGHCTAVGSEAGWKNSTGSNNTYLGYHAGNTVTTGSSNTIIGYGADISNGTYSNTTAIGNLAVANASNKVRIGNTSVTSIGGQVAWSVFSDERVKTDIKEDVPGLKFIKLLKPVTYHYDIGKEENIMGVKTSDKWAGKYDITQMQFSGFSAQQVEKAAQQAGYDFSGVDAPKNDKDLYALRYNDFVVPLVKAVQELSKINNDKDSIIHDLEARLAKIESLINVQRLTVNNQQPAVVSSASLQQNILFTNTTTIGYSLPDKFSSAQMIITDKNGSQFKQINISSAGKGTINVDASTLASGAYNYSLY